MGDKNESTAHQVFVKYIQMSGQGNLTVRKSVDSLYIQKEAGLDHHLIELFLIQLTNFLLDC